VGALLVPVTTGVGIKIPESVPAKAREMIRTRLRRIPRRGMMNDSAIYQV